MAELNLPNIREGGNIRFRIGLEDNGVAVDWSGLEGIRVFLYADAQKQVSGECTIEVDAEDNTVLACLYSGDDPQFRGINSVLVRAKYQGEIKVYDKPAINIVARTADADGVLVIDDPVVPVQINVEEVSTSLLNNAIDAAINAAAEAEKAIEDVRDEETAIQAAEAARVLAEQGRVSAEQSRVAQASADHTLAGQDHTRAESDHGTASDDHTLAVSDHGVASGDHTTALGDHSLAESDHTRAESDHGVAGSDHTIAQGDHTQAGSDHSTAVADHTQAGADHTVAGQDHTQAGTDHNTAASDHTQAGLDHTQAGEDHTQALADHQVMAGYDDRLDAVEEEVDQLEAEVDDFIEEYDGGKYPLRGWDEGQYITTNQAIGSVCPKTVTTNAAWRSIIVPVEQNIIKFIVNGEGGGSPRLWCFLDSDDKVLSQADAQVSSSGDALELVPPTSATQLIINSKNNGICYRVIYGTKEEIEDVVNTFDSRLQTVETTANSLSVEVDGKPETIINDFSGYDTVPFYISAAGDWTKNYATSCIIPANKYRGQNILVSASQTGNSLVAFLKGTLSPVNGTPAPLCNGETGSYGIATNGIMSLFVPNDCDWMCVLLVMSSTQDRTPQSIVIKKADGIKDTDEYVKSMIFGDIVGMADEDGRVGYLTINGSNLFVSTSYSSDVIRYAYFASETKVRVYINRVGNNVSLRGNIGYVDSLSDIANGNSIKAPSGERLTKDKSSYTDYTIPAGKYLVIGALSSDLIGIYLVRSSIYSPACPQNILNGSYSWWTSPHSERKVLGMNDFTVVAYIKNTSEMCVALRNNNTREYAEKVVMDSASIDDHNAPACAFLTDGRIIVTCTKGHAQAPNQNIFISDNPFSIDSFSEKVFATSGECTYSRLIIHGGYIFIFWREALSGHSYWHGVYSTDEFETNSGEFDFIRQSYVYLEKTTDPDYIKIYPCGHPTENAVELDAIRSGYIKLSSMEILKGDGVTKVADLGTFVDNTDFDILVDASLTSKNRMLDAAITPVGVDRFVYAKGDPASNPYDGKYYYYDNGTVIEIVATGTPFYTASKYVGGAIIARQNKDCIIVAREDNGVWKLERYLLKNGDVDSVSLLDYSGQYIIRPIEAGGCQFIYQKGGYDPTTFKDFDTNIVFKEIAE